MHGHVHACLFPVSAIPDSTLLLASGVLECRKRLAGRFNIQLAGSQSSYITAENTAHAPPPHPHLRDPSYTLASFPSFSAPPSVALSSLSPVGSLAFVGAAKVRVCVCVCACVCVCVGGRPVCLSALLLIAFDLNGLFFIWRLLPTLPPPPLLHPHPAVRRTDAQIGQEERKKVADAR